MNEKKKRPRRRFAIHTAGDDLEDCIEQETEKSGAWEKAKKQEAEAELPQASSAGVPAPPTKKRVSVERRSPRLPQGKREAEPKLPSAFESYEPTEKTASVTSAKEERRVHLLFVGFLIASLLAALALLTGVLVMGRAYTPSREDEQTDPEGALPPSSSQGASDAREKIIFVKQYDDTSGLLTPPEIYAKNADAVVSIAARNKGSSKIGSGAILSCDGYIATAYHVIEGMSELTVILSDRTVYSATLIQGDAMTDLAVIKIDARDLPTVVFGDSDELLTGERVFAIGTSASTDYAGSLSSGEIAYASRTVRIYDTASQELQKKMTLLQTNAPLQYGNSGCPLFDEYGRVVGIVTMKVGSEESGIGLAIPSDGAVPILKAMVRGATVTDELRAAVSVPAPKLGIVGEPSEELGRRGVRVLRFTDEAVDADTILKTGDLILQIDGMEIRETRDVLAAIQLKNPTDSVLVTVLRSGQQLSFHVILGK